MTISALPYSFQTLVTFGYAVYQIGFNKNKYESQAAYRLYSNNWINPSARSRNVFSLGNQTSFQGCSQPPKMDPPTQQTSPASSSHPKENPPQETPQSLISFQTSRIAWCSSLEAFLWVFHSKRQQTTWGTEEL